MEDRNESLFYLGSGPLAAILLGMALVPLRGLTTAANLAFAFMALTIVVAEFGGRGAAMATAVASALSLDFFLTQPYLKLSIEDKHDVIAFIGLAVCGLIAAALGSQSRERISVLRGVEKHRNLLRAALRDWNAAAPGEPQVTNILRELRDVFPLAAAVVRDDRNRVLASAEANDGLRGIPEDVLQPDTLQPSADSDGKTVRWNAPLPAAGGRIALVVNARPLGWLDVWGNGVPASPESRRGFVDCARLLAVLLASLPPRTVGEMDRES